MSELRWVVRYDPSRITASNTLLVGVFPFEAADEAAADAAFAGFVDREPLDVYGNNESWRYTYANTAAAAAAFKRNNGAQTANGRGVYIVYPDRYRVIEGVTDVDPELITKHASAVVEGVERVNKI